MPTGGQVVFDGGVITSFIVSPLEVRKHGRTVSRVPVQPMVHPLAERDLGEALRLSRLSAASRASCPVEDRPLALSLPTLQRWFNWFDAEGLAGLKYR